MDPENPNPALRFKNFVLDIPAHPTDPEGYGDLFCSGHAWTYDGRLFVAGGTRYSTPTQQIPSNQRWGNELAYLYDPSAGPDGTWWKQADLADWRWYPTVTALGNDNLHSPQRPRLLVFGGTRIVDITGAPRNPADPSMNTYESFVPPPPAFTNGAFELLPVRQFPGPRYQTPLNSPLDLYPRMFLLSDGNVFMAGMWPLSAWVDHVNAPGVWPCVTSTVCDPPNVANALKQYASCVLMPTSAFDAGDVVLTTGGAFGSPWGPRRDVESFATADPQGLEPAWTAGPQMNLFRDSHNAVILPDASVFVHGGGGLAVRYAEIFKDGVWTVGTGSNFEASVRAYHATAVLLPSGRVLSAGADLRFFDYQVYEPPYIWCNQPRPVWVSSPATLSHGANYTVTYQPLPLGVTVQKVVLMAPASITHHTDMHQRYIEMLPATSDTPGFGFQVPTNRNKLPPGYYMMFLVTNGRVPSEARFVQVTS